MFDKWRGLGPKCENGEWHLPDRTKEETGFDLVVVATGSLNPTPEVDNQSLPAGVAGVASRGVASTSSSSTTSPFVEMYPFGALWTILEVNGS